jgi:hypothetical protein
VDRQAILQRIVELGLLAVLRAPDPAGDFAGISEKGRRFLAAIREVKADAAPKAFR